MLDFTSTETTMSSTWIIYFNRMQPIILNKDNIDGLNNFLNQFVDEVRGEIEASGTFLKSPGNFSGS